MLQDKNGGIKIGELKNSIKWRDIILYSAIAMFLITNYQLKIIKNVETIGIVITIFSLIYSIVDNRSEAIDREKDEEEKLNFKKQIKSKELMSDFFMELFFKELSKEIPNIIIKIRMVTSHIDRTTELVELMERTQLIEDKSLFYKYVDESNYEVIKESIQDLQDHISLITNMNEETYNRRKVDLDLEFEKRISIFYKTLIEYYSPF